MKSKNGIIKAARIIGVLILLCSIIPLGPSIYFYNKTNNFLKNATKTEGTVVDIKERKNSEGNITYYPLISYADKNGQEHTKNGSGSFPSKYEMGDRVTIFYDPQKPRNAKIESFIGFWIGPIIGGIIGILPLSIGLFFIFVLPQIIRVTQSENQTNNNLRTATCDSQTGPNFGQDAFEEAKASDTQSNTWNMLCHVSSLAGYIGVPFGTIIMPLAIWLCKKDEHPMVNVHAKESLNFQISMTIYSIISIFLCLIIIGFLILPFLFVLDIILVIIASVKADRGEVYHYPLSIRFIK